MNRGARHHTTSRVPSGKENEYEQVGSVLEVPLEEIDVDNLTFQYRLSTDTRDLVESLRVHGQLEPIELLGVKPFQVIDGFRRAHILKELGRKTIRAIIHQSMDSGDAHRRAFVKNVARKNLSPLDRANAIRLAKLRGMSRDDVQCQLGMSDRQMQRYERLLGFAKVVQDLLEHGTITMNHAVALSRLPDDQVAEWAQRAIGHDWSALELEKELRQAERGRRAHLGRHFISIHNGSLRMYDAKISINSPVEKKVEFISALERAIAFIRQDSSPPNKSAAVNNGRTSYPASADTT